MELLEFSLVNAAANFFFTFLGDMLTGVALSLANNFIVRHTLVEPRKRHPPCTV